MKIKMIMKFLIYLETASVTSERTRETNPG